MPNATRTTTSLLCDGTRFAPVCYAGGLGLSAGPRPHARVGRFAHATGFGSRSELLGERTERILVAQLGAHVNEHEAKRRGYRHGEDNAEQSECRAAG